MKNRDNNPSDNWMTPPEFYKALDYTYNFNFDPCPLREGEIPEEEDGLLIEWGTRNYVNPPYSQKLKEAFIRKAYEESEKGKLCVMLLPVSTSTKIFHEVILPNAELRFIRGRIPFIGTNTKGQLVNYHLLHNVGLHDEYDKEELLEDGSKKYVKNSGQHDSMLVIFDGRNK